MEKRYIIKPKEHYEKVAMASRIIGTFFELSYVAAKKGGIWVSASGGTANAIAHQLYKAVDLSFEDALMIVNVVGSAEFRHSCDINWYNSFYHLGSSDPRWDICTILRAAARANLAPYQPAKRKPLP